MIPAPSASTAMTPHAARPIRSPFWNSTSFTPDMSTFFIFMAVSLHIQGRRIAFVEGYDSEDHHFDIGFHLLGGWRDRRLERAKTVGEAGPGARIGKLRPDRAGEAVEQNLGRQETQTRVGESRHDPVGVL